MSNRICSVLALTGILCLSVSAQPCTGGAFGGGLFSGPATVNPNEHVSICVSNLAQGSVPVTLLILDANNGAILSSEQVTLQGNSAVGGVPGGPGGGSGGPCGSPASGGAAEGGVGIGVCQEIVVTKPTNLIGHAAVNPQPLPPHSVSLVASLQIFSVGTTGAPMNIRYIALTPLHPPNPCRAAQ